MAAVKPSMRSTETYTESNFLRLYTRTGADDPQLPLVTLEHLSYRAEPAADGCCGWHCRTIVDAEAMSREDALFIARSYAEQHGVPVIYESNGQDL